MNDYSFYADTIRRTVNMKDIITLYNLTPNRSGFICCPIHHEKTPSCKIYPNGKGWWCYGCNQGGSVIDFVMQVNQCSFVDAIKFINSSFNLGLTDSKPDLRKAREFKKRQQMEEAENNEINRLYRQLTDYYRSKHYILVDRDKTKPFTAEEVNALSITQYLDYAFQELDYITDRGEKLSTLRNLMKNMTALSTP